MAPGARYVKAGALLALEPSYRDNGRQAAELAIKILGGMSPKTMPVATPRAVCSVVNLETLEHITGVALHQHAIDGSPL